MGKERRIVGSALLAALVASSCYVPVQLDAAAAGALDPAFQRAVAMAVPAEDWKWVWDAGLWPSEYEDTGLLTTPVYRVRWAMLALTQITLLLAGGMALVWARRRERRALDR